MTEADPEAAPASAAATSVAGAAVRYARMRLMRLLGRLRLSFWVIVIGTVVLYGFFVILATISPGEVAAATAVVAALAVIFTLRNLRLAAQLADRGGDPHLRRALNRIRERRGF